MWITLGSRRWIAHINHLNMSAWATSHVVPVLLTKFHPRAHYVIDTVLTSQIIERVTKHSSTGYVWWMQKKDFHYYLPAGCLWWKYFVHGGSPHSVVGRQPGVTARCWDPHYILHYLHDVSVALGPVTSDFDCTGVGDPHFRGPHCDRTPTVSWF